MTPAALAFAAGAAFLQVQAALPPFATVWMLPLLVLLAIWQRRLAIPACFAIGFLWAAGWAHWRMADRLAPELEGRDIAVVGVVAGLPAIGERALRFEFEVESAPGGEKLPGRLLVSWYRASAWEDAPAVLASPVHPGERWLLTLRLRRPHGLVNPYGFDYEAWLLERGVGATGYVRARGEQRKLGRRSTPLDWIERAREAVRDRFLAALGPTPAAGILAALAVGDQRAISTEEWQLFNRTGVTHLMSISGLHVTLVSGLVAWLVALGWRRAPALALRLPARKAAAIAAIVAALGYTLIAGFGVPAQRTFWMVTIVAAALWSGEIASPVRTLALALAVIVCLDPWAMLAPGLWLSFGAVLLIFYGAVGWSAPGSRVAQWARVQWGITIGLAPAALLLFGQVSVAGPIANAVAIPVVSVVVTPLALFAAVVPWDALLEGAAFLVTQLLQFLEWCATLPGAQWQQHAPSLWTVLVALAGAAWLLAPRGVPWRAGGLALMAPAFCLAPIAPPPGEVWITAFDVGQGLAVLARTRTRTMLYDAGPAWAADADSGSRVVVPAMRGAGLERLDLLVLSHEDGDHIGGALSVLETLEVEAMASSLAAGHPLRGMVAAPRRCAAGESWQWDGVRFAFLTPDRSGSAKRNDQSCVLRIAVEGGAILLTGDIERSAEKALLSSAVRSDVMLVPHHGSRTSSTPEFIAAVAPRWAIVAAGYRNRFGHPNGEVLERYRSAGVQIARTDLQGSIAVRLSAEGVGVQGERARRGRYWLQ
ncbi:MAG TPA: DNA internalization-related competence protein ComEC/Rec2 [Burkholderiales bacterium]|nr:DNA internalization-related competence protein ComEC/Rec2 [Burkholderiales bacterium]